MRGCEGGCGEDIGWQWEAIGGYRENGAVGIIWGIWISKGLCGAIG